MSDTRQASLFSEDDLPSTLRETPPGHAGAFHVEPESRPASIQLVLRRHGKLRIWVKSVQQKLSRWL